MDLVGCVKKRFLADKAFVIKSAASHSNLVLQTRLTEQGEGEKSERRSRRKQEKPSGILIGCLFFISPRRHKDIYEF